MIHARRRTAIIQNKIRKIILEHSNTRCTENGGAISDKIARTNNNRCGAAEQEGDPLVAVICLPAEGPFIFCRRHAPAIRAGIAFEFNKFSRL